MKYYRVDVIEEISIHAPRVGSDDGGDSMKITFAEFQSTLPVWGATEGEESPAAPCSISIHAPRVGSDSPVREVKTVSDISIHAPRVGSDQMKQNRV